MQSLAYTPLERLHVSRPVQRIRFVTERCRDRVVLDLGCRDETAPSKCNATHWLHGEIINLAERMIPMLSGGPTLYVNAM